MRVQVNIHIVFLAKRNASNIAIVLYLQKKLLIECTLKLININHEICAYFFLALFTYFVSNKFSNVASEIIEKFSCRSYTFVYSEPLTN